MIEVTCGAVCAASLKRPLACGDTAELAPEFEARLVASGAARFARTAGPAEPVAAADPAGEEPAPGGGDPVGELEAMAAAQLREEAEALGCQVPDDAGREDIIAAIEEAMSAAAPAIDALGPQ